MTERYSELFLIDAMRLCQYLAGEDGTISISPVEDFAGFPDLPENEPLPEAAQMVVVTRGDEVVAECLYKYATDEDGSLKRRNRWLARVMFGKEVTRARREKGMTRADLAEATGYRVQAIERIERGRYELSLEPMYRIAFALGCEITLKKQ